MPSALTTVTYETRLDEFYDTGFVDMLPLPEQGYRLLSHVRH
jgi:hypothetical protein